MPFYLNVVDWIFVGNGFWKSMFLFFVWREQLTGLTAGSLCVALHGWCTAWICYHVAVRTWISWLSLYIGLVLYCIYSNINTKPVIIIQIRHFFHIYSEYLIIIDQFYYIACCTFLANTNSTCIKLPEIYATNIDDDGTVTCMRLHLKKQQKTAKCRGFVNQYRLCAYCYFSEYSICVGTGATIGKGTKIMI